MKSDRAGGRTSTFETPYGSFDAGAQYFTVRDVPDLPRPLDTVPGSCRPWSANTVRVLDAAGRVVAASPLPKDAHWVAKPGMGSLVAAWAQPCNKQAACTPRPAWYASNLIGWHPVAGRSARKRPMVPSISWPGLMSF